MDKKTIPVIFHVNALLEIPYFQRSYVWNTENWDRFLEDMKEVCISKKEYFMGTYITKDKANGVSSVIDGQQRFTTIILFFLVLAIKNNSYSVDFARYFMNFEDDIVLKHNHTDRPIFELLVKNKALSDSQKEEYKNNNIYKAYNYFMDNINPDDYNYKTLFKYIYFIPIELLTNDDEQQIFDTINSLGVRLTTAELLKNHLFSTEDLDLFKDTWEKCFEKDQAEKDFWDAIVGSREKHSNLDTFLYSYINIYNDKDIRYKSLFNTYKEYLGKTLNNPGSKKGFIEDLIAYAQLYRKYINPDIQNEVLTECKNSIDRLNIVFFGLDTTTLLPYCLYVLKNAKPEEQGKIFGYLETYIIRRMLCHNWTKNYNKKFKTFLTNKIVTFDVLLKNIMDGANTEDSIPTDAELDTNMFYSHTNAQARGILYLLETGLRIPSKVTTSVLPLESYDLEHIMPSEWTTYWPLKQGEDTPERIADRNKHIGYLGNKTLLAKGLNKAIKNNSFDVKKNGTAKMLGYNKYAVGLETFDFNKYSEWTEKTIEERHKELISKIKTVWPYSSVR